MRILAGLGVAMVVLALSSVCSSAEQNAPSAQAPKGEAKAAASQESAKFEQAFAKWKVLLEELRTLRTEYKNAEPQRRGEIRRQYNQLAEKAEKMQVELLDSAEK